MHVCSFGCFFYEAFSVGGGQSGGQQCWRHHTQIIITIICSICCFFSRLIQHFLLLVEGNENESYEGKEGRELYAVRKTGACNLGAILREDLEVRSTRYEIASGDEDADWVR